MESCQVGVIQSAITASTSLFSGWTTRTVCCPSSWYWYRSHQEVDEGKHGMTLLGRCVTVQAGNESLLESVAKTVPKGWHSITTLLPEWIPPDYPAASFPDRCHAPDAKGASGWTFRCGANAVLDADQVLLGQIVRKCFTLVLHMHQLCCKGSTIKEASGTNGYRVSGCPHGKDCCWFDGPHERNRMLQSLHLQISL